MSNNDDEDEAGDATEIRHESFGVIRIGHTSGNHRLFGSSVDHQNYITLTICKASCARDSQTHCDKIDAQEEIIKVALSGVQFGEMLVNTNTHRGTPCTIQRMAVDGKYKSIPEPPTSTSSKEDYVREFKEKLARVANRLETLRFTAKSMTQQQKVPKKDLHALYGEIERVQTDLAANLPFVMEMFNERIEQVICEAKGEIEAFQSELIRHLGTKTLGEQHVLPDKDISVRG